jgi:hypothetical protein
MHRMPGIFSRILSFVGIGIICKEWYTGIQRHPSPLPACHTQIPAGMRPHFMRRMPDRRPTESHRTLPVLLPRAADTNIPGSLLLKSGEAAAGVRKTARARWAPTTFSGGGARPGYYYEKLETKVLFAR